MDKVENYNKINLYLVFKNGTDLIFLNEVKSKSN